MFSRVLPLKNVVKVLIKVDTYVAFFPKVGAKIVSFAKEVDFIPFNGQVTLDANLLISDHSCNKMKKKKWTYFQQPMFPKNNVSKHVNKGS